MSGRVWVMIHLLKNSKNTLIYINSSVWEKVVWSMWHIRKKNFLFNIFTGHEKSQTWVCSQTLPPSRKQWMWNSLYPGGMKMNYTAELSRWQTLCLQHALLTLTLHHGTSIWLTYIGALGSFGWNPHWMFGAVSVASRKSSSCLVLSPTVWGQCDVSWAPGHRWSHSLDLYLFWELWLPLTSG